MQPTVAYSVRHCGSIIELMAFSISEHAYVSSQNSPVGIQAYLTRHSFPVICAFKSNIAASILLAFMLWPFIVLCKLLCSKEIKISGSRYSTLFNIHHAHVTPQASRVITVLVITDNTTVCTYINEWQANNSFGIPALVFS